jgi:hypothetical protein
MHAQRARAISTSCIVSAADAGCLLCFSGTQAWTQLHVVFHM